jgi:hypothetical protein
MHMEILGASTVQAAETFLHPGYISAYPRTLYPEMGYPIQHSDPTVQLDMAEALRLQNETLASAASTGDGSVWNHAFASLSAWPTVVVAAAAFFGLLALYVVMKDRWRWRWPGRLKTGFTLAPLLAVAMMVGTCGPEPLPNQKPWEGVPLQQYANPDQATLAIMHGIIADAIINVGQPIENLANIQNEVGLPIANPTEGMAYALLTYGVDGWGREFELSRSGDQYTVTSAGPDGQFGNGDDLSMTVSQTSNSDWDMQRYAFFTREVSGQRYIYFHRWTGDHFKYIDQDLALSHTDTKLFDVFAHQDLTTDAQTAADTAWDQATSGVTHTPLILQVFHPTTY